MHSIFVLEIFLQLATSKESIIQKALLKGNVNYLHLTFVSKDLSHFAIHLSGLNLFSDIITILS